MGSSVQDVTARAKQLISERKYRDAVRACRRVLLSKPDAVPVRLLLAQALLALGRHDEVRIEMLALSKKAPDVGAAWRLLGEAYIRGGQPDAAAEALREALKLDPADDEARDLLEEVGEVDAPPKMETIDRWFGGEPTHAEARIDELVAVNMLHRVCAITVVVLGLLARSLVVAPVPRKCAGYTGPEWLR